MLLGKGFLSRKRRRKRKVTRRMRRRERDAREEEGLKWGKREKV